MINDLGQVTHLSGSLKLYLFPLDDDPDLDYPRKLSPEKENAYFIDK